MQCRQRFAFAAFTPTSRGRNLYMPGFADGAEIQMAGEDLSSSMGSKSRFISSWTVAEYGP
jgi:hypothetical protein